MTLPSSCESRLTDGFPSVNQGSIDCVVQNVLQAVLGEAAVMDCWRDVPLRFNFCLNTKLILPENW